MREYINIDNYYFETKSFFAFKIRSDIDGKFKIYLSSKYGKENNVVLEIEARNMEEAKNKIEMDIFGI